MENKTPIIFIVDDQLTVRETLRGFLHRDGYELHQFDNGQAALSAMETTLPDVILLDVMMPGLNGYQVCRKVKGTPKWEHIPIILITALDDKRDLAEGLSAGADDFLTKPVNRLELQARVRSMLRIKHQFDELEEALRLREDLANMVVHDMRNPLTTIIGLSELMLIREISGDQIKRFANSIYTQSIRLKGFADDILMMAKLEHGELRLKRVPTSLQGLIDKVIDSHTSAAEARTITLAKAFPIDDRQVLVDPPLFERVLDNLLSNALKFTPKSSTVTVAIVDNEAQNSLQFRIIDEGPGIPKEDRKNVFEKYRISEQRQSNVAQFGLGLAFCQMMVQAHGGTISVEENLPTGAIFVIDLPCAEIEDESPINGDEIKISA